MQSNITMQRVLMICLFHVVLGWNKTNDDRSSVGDYHRCEFLEEKLDEIYSNTNQILFYVIISFFYMMFLVYHSI